MGFRFETVVQEIWKGKRPVLFYLYAEPEYWPDGKSVSLKDRMQHRAELISFSELVAGDEVSFRSCSYPELLATWRADPSQLISAHAAAITNHFLS